MPQPFLLTAFEFNNSNARSRRKGRLYFLSAVAVGPFGQGQRAAARVPGLDDRDAGPRSIGRAVFGTALCQGDLGGAAAKHIDGRFKRLSVPCDAVEWVSLPFAYVTGGQDDCRAPRGQTV